MDVSQIFIFLNKNSARYLEENVRHFLRDPNNAKTAEPIRPTFVIGLHMVLGAVSFY